MDARRAVPPTHAVLDDQRLAAAQERLGRPAVRDAVRAAQRRVRAGELAASDLIDEVLGSLPRRATSLRPVINATGVVLHTNLGRAPLSPAARQALAVAAGYVDVEYDLGTGARGTRGRGTLEALHAALPDAGGVLVLNNGAAALLLAVTVLARGREVVWSRGEMVEIGDGFRLPDLVAASGARIREIGTTNRTVVADYAQAVGPRTGCILKVHQSNFRVDGFTASAGVAELATLGVPVVVDAGSGLLRPDRRLAGEPDLASILRAGASLVVASADKLLGGPQGGIAAGDAALVSRLRRHPLYRALRVDKLTLAALEATLTGPEPPASLAIHADPEVLRARAERIAGELGPPAVAVPSEGAVGGGGGAGVALPGWAVSLPEDCARELRRGDPAVVGRVERGHCLLDLRCVPPEDDARLIAAVREAGGGRGAAPTGR